jgi:hypothetical protein
MSKPRPESYSLAKHYGQKGFRMAKILFGRETTRRDVLKGPEQLLVTIHSQVPPSPVNTETNECMFCGESPALAEMTVRTCVGCSGAYCSARCQKAHWKIHRELCGKEVKMR